MGKLVVLKLDGDLEQRGFRVTLEIGLDNARPEIEICGNLPASPDLATHLNQWRNNYRSLGSNSRIKPKEIIYDGSINKRVEECRFSGSLLTKYLRAWLESQEFLCIDKRLREELNRNETIRVLIRTDNNLLQKLPWHLWDFFYRYSLAEFALSGTACESIQTPQKKNNKGKVRILAVLGNSTGIDIQKDRQLLENLPNAEIIFLVEPERKKLNNYLWQQWDILFFAGHSETDGDIGRIFINKTDSLTIEELQYGLQKTISLGLQLAIFNSCDGLGLARQLANLHIPQIIVMREPVPDKVAQEFLKHFLTAFASGSSLYLASREAREKLQGLEDDFPNATWLPVIFQNPSVAPPTWQELRGGAIEGNDSTVVVPPRPLVKPQQKPKRRLFNVLVASVAITASVMGVRYVGMLQTWELQAFDRLMTLRSHEGQDRRLLIVTVDEADIQYQIQKGMNMRWSISDQALAELLNKLNRYQPRTIGIDIYRDFAVDRNYPDLASRLQQDKRIFAVCKVSAPDDGAPDGIPPPPEVAEERLSFSDFVADDNEIARRQILHLTPPLTSPCPAEYAFSLQLALHYLQAKGIKAEINPQGYLQIGDVVFKQLKNHTSGYQSLDARGYQILLNYRSLASLQNIAQQVPLRDILENRIKPELVESVKNRVVLIGVTAFSTADDWKTPYSASASPNEKRIPGVFVQAQMVSHILSAVLDRRPLIWWLPAWAEAIWIWGWSLLGAILAWHLRKPVYLGLAIAGALLALFGICYGVFIQAGWIPLVPSVLVLIVTAVVLRMRWSRSVLQERTSRVPPSASHSNFVNNTKDLDSDL